MQEYEIEVEELLQRIVKVKAESKEEAVKIVMEKYRKEEIVLDAGDFIEVNFR